MNVPLKMRVLGSGKTQTEIAHKLKMREAYLSRIINGWEEPDDKLKGKIAKILRCPVDEIFPPESRAEKIIRARERLDAAPVPRKGRLAATADGIVDLDSGEKFNFDDEDLPF